MDNKEFLKFYGILEKEIKKFKVKNSTEVQKEQVEALIKAEKEFRAALIDHYWGESVYAAFVEYITEERNNILVARPYFRERQKNFTDKISKVLKKKDHKKLYKFNINWNFINFVLKCKNWGANSKVVKLANKVDQIRHQLIIMNMPLAISRARMFFNKTPKSHLSYMDFVQMSIEGLMAGIDKFVLPYSPVFRSVIIGRIVGDQIENYSKTMLYFYPGEKRILYRANKVLKQFNGVIDYVKLAEIVNDGMPESYKTTPDHLASLLAAASAVSMESSEVKEDETKPIAQYSAPEETQPDNQVEDINSMAALQTALKVLNPFELKFLRLKGIQVNEL